MIIIRASEKRPLTLAPETEEEAKVQELWILLCTVLGECPFYRDFGVSNDYLHMPVDAAKTAMTVAIIEAFRKFEPDVEIVSITLNNGTEVDLNDTHTLYRVCTSNYNATLDGSIFLDKTPVVPESEAPVDNLTVIKLLREEARENDGHISVDTEPRGIRLEEALDDAA